MQYKRLNPNGEAWIDDIIPVKEITGCTCHEETGYIFYWVEWDTEHPSGRARDASPQWIMAYDLSPRLDEKMAPLVIRIEVLRVFRTFIRSINIHTRGIVVMSSSQRFKQSREV